MRVWIVGAIAVAWMWATPIEGHPLQSSKQNSSTSSAPVVLRVTAFRGTIRQAASPTAPVAKAVEAGTLLEGTRRDNDWFVVRVELADGQLHDGFISSTVVELVSASSAQGAAPLPPTQKPLTAGGQATAAAATSLDPKEYVRQQLQMQYVPTKMAGDATTVLRAGSVLTVQKEGAGANMVAPGTISGALITFVNNYKDGQVKQSFPSRLLIPNDLIRSLQVGEGVYLLKVDVKDTEVVVTVQSCGSCTATAPDANSVPYRSAVAFQFPKGYLRMPDVRRIQETIGQVFSVAPADSDAGTQQNPPLADASSSPPAAPPAEPAIIEIGQTTDQVVAAMGPPATVIKLGTKEIYVYKDLKITFLSGKVSDVE